MPFAKFQRAIRALPAPGFQLQQESKECLCKCALKSCLERELRAAPAGLMRADVCLIRSLALGYLQPGLIIQPLPLIGSRLEYEPEVFQASQR